MGNSYEYIYIILFISIIVLLILVYYIVFTNNTKEDFKVSNKGSKYKDIIKKEIKDREFQNDKRLKEMKSVNKKRRLFLKKLTSKIVETKNIKSRNKLIDRLKLKLKKKN